MLFQYYIDFGLKPLHAKIYYTECNNRTELKNVEYTFFYFIFNLSVSGKQRSRMKSNKFVFYGWHFNVRSISFYFGSGLEFSRSEN